MEIELLPTLIVDLDGTLLKNDFFLENLVLTPAAWFTCDIVESKCRVLKNVKPNRTVLYHLANPYVLKRVRNHEGLTVLMTASPQFFGDYIDKTMGLGFGRVYGSSNYNLKGKRKLKLILELGLHPFIYCGNSREDDYIGHSNHCVEYIKI